MKIPPYVEEKIGKKFGMLTVVSFLRRSLLTKAIDTLLLAFVIAAMNGS